MLCCVVLCCELAKEERAGDWGVSVGRKERMGMRRDGESRGKAVLVGLGIGMVLLLAHRQLGTNVHGEVKWGRRGYLYIWMEDDLIRLHSINCLY